MPARRRDGGTAASRVAVPPASGAADREAAPWRRLAADLDLAFLDRIPDAPQETGEPPPAEVFDRVDRIAIGAGPTMRLVMAPSPQQRGLLVDFLARHPQERGRLAIATPREIRRALIARWSTVLTRRAVRCVIDRDPLASAATAPGAGRFVLAGLAVFVVGASLIDVLPPAVAAWTAVFLSIGVFRALVADQLPAARPPPPLPDHVLPPVAVLVPLHREAAVVPALVAALARLDYPADRLDVRLIVEADDRPTVVAARTAVAGTRFDVIEVPPSQPRTKPKALGFALATVAAEIVTVYDAEDRPDPDQLRLAAAAFAAGPADLAVVQAVLDIDHAEPDRPWLVRQFEIEYAVLFRGLLPWLADRGLFLPLGGTSNHFRRSALDAVGGWDPHNVTEDADVAVRLTRAGLRAGVIASATQEEAPNRWRPWAAQRSRWVKGWLQTWFTHMRTPVRLHRELGPVSALAFHLVFAGQLLSAFAFGPSLLVIVLQLCGMVPLFATTTLDGDVLALSQLLACASGILGAYILALRVSARSPRRFRLFDVLTMPLYWCLISVAAVMAAIDLVRAPTRWNKTPHGIAARRSRP